MQYHGGDIYRNQIRQDFSVNTNPLGMPDSVREALSSGGGGGGTLPGYPCTGTYKRSLQNSCGYQRKSLCFGNGASEFVSIAVFTRSKTIEMLIPVPYLFLGY